jgi:hypothetical protein
MKKLFVVAFALFSVLLLVSCNGQTSSPTTEPSASSNVIVAPSAAVEPDSVGESVITAQPTTKTDLTTKPPTTGYPWSRMPKAGQIATNDLERRVETLISQDDVICGIFVFNDLPTENEPLVDTYHAVIPNYFDTFQKLKGYVENTFVKAESDRLLYHFRQDKPMYLEYDGVFCKDESLAGYRGGAFGLEGFLYSYTQSSPDMVELTITGWARGDDYSDVPVEIHTRLLLEDGVWKLEKMLDQ